MYAAMLKVAGGKTNSTMYPGVPHDFSGLLPRFESVVVFRQDHMKGFSWLLSQ